MHFTRYNTASNPISPWGDRRTAATNFYYCRLDTDYDEVIPGTGDALNPPADGLRRSVIVWTINPDAPPSDPDNHIIGSWQP